jgi:hypothetical protein
MLLLHVTGQGESVGKVKVADFAGKPIFGDTVYMFFVGVLVERRIVDVSGAAKVTEKSFYMTCHWVRDLSVLDQGEFIGEVSGATVTLDPVELCQIKMI